MPGVIGTAPNSADPPFHIEYGANAFGEDAAGARYAIGLSGIAANSLNYNVHLRVIKYGPAGKVLWDKSSEQNWTYPTEPSDAHAPPRQISGGGAWDGAVDAAGNVYSTGPGNLLPWPGRGEDWVTTKIDTAGGCSGRTRGPRRRSTTWTGRRT